MVPTVPFFVSEPETLSVALEVTGGQSLSFGPDREDEGEIPLSIEWSTQNPGGFADGATTLTRPAWISAADAPLMASYKVTTRAANSVIRDGQRRRRRSTRTRFGSRPRGSRRRWTTTSSGASSASTTTSPPGASHRSNASRR